MVYTYSISRRNGLPVPHRGIVSPTAYLHFTYIEAHLQSTTDVDILG